MKYHQSVAVVALLFASFAGAQQATPPTAHKTGGKADAQGQMKKEARISKDSARAIARATIPNSKVSSTELERENGKLIYSIDLKVPGKAGREEVHVDAMTGAVISQQHETAKEEKAEKSEKKAEKKAEKADEKAEKKGEMKEHKPAPAPATKKP